MDRTDINAVNDYLYCQHLLKLIGDKNLRLMTYDCALNPSFVLFYKNTTLIESSMLSEILAAIRVTYGMSNDGVHVREYQKREVGLYSITSV